jgi:hypothetical protein
VYIYCNYKEQDQSATNLIASLLRQLVEVNRDLSDQVTALHKSHESKQTRPSLSEFSNVLESEVTRFSKVFFVVDALDEYNEIDGSRHHLLDELRKIESHIFLLVTSRDIGTIKQDMGDAMRLEIRARDEDIQIYLQARIQSERRLRKLTETDEILQRDIITTIAEKAQGM